MSLTKNEEEESHNDVRMSLILFLLVNCDPKCDYKLESKLYVFEFFWSKWNNLSIFLLKHFKETYFDSHFNITDVTITVTDWLSTKLDKIYKFLSYKLHTLSHHHFSSC